MPSSDAGEIEVLTMTEAVRRRPGMYFGDVRHPAGLMNYLLELIDDLITIRRASTVRIEIAAENTLRIEHNGTSFAAADFAASMSPACLVAKIAVSRFFHARTDDGILSFRDGQATDPIALSDATGLWCQPDPRIFTSPVPLDIFLVTGMAQPFAVSHPGTSITLSEAGGERVLHYPRGPLDRLLELGRGDMLHVPLRGRAQTDSGSCDLAIAICDHDHDVLETYVNGQKCEGGKHEAQLRSILECGLGRRVAVSAVMIFELDRPCFAGPRRDLLADERAGQILARAMEPLLIELARS
jgi:DNA gyrase/topoisomerase IV subunit B